MKIDIDPIVIKINDLGDKLFAGETKEYYSLFLNFRKVPCFYTIRAKGAEDETGGYALFTPKKLEEFRPKDTVSEVLASELEGRNRVRKHLNAWKEFMQDPEREIEKFREDNPDILFDFSHTESATAVRNINDYLAKRYQEVECFNFFKITF